MRRCPVCYNDVLGPIAYPGCRQHHKDVPPPASIKVMAPTADQPLEFTSSCVIPTTWMELPLRRVIPHNHDTSIFEFGLPEGAKTLSLPTCACLLLLAPGCEHGGGDAVRPYTPISPPTLEGAFQLIIKRYKEWGSKIFPQSYCPPGAVSNYLFELPVGSCASFKHISFNVKLPYKQPDGSLGFAGVKTITMVAVGVGIAPMIQALHEMLDGNPDDQTQKKHSRFRTIYHIGSRYDKVVRHRDDCPKDCGRPCKRPRQDPPGWDELPSDRREQGWVTEASIAKYAFPPASDTKVFVCGLPGVYTKLCGPRGTPLEEATALHNLGYSNEMVVKF